MSKKNVTTTGQNYNDYTAGRQRSTQTTWNNQRAQRDFDPGALEQYRQFQPQIGQALGDFMGNPWKSGYFQQALGRSQQQIGQMGRTNLKGILGLASQGNFGTGNMPAFMASMAGQSQRGTQRMQSEALTNLLLGAGQARLQATGMAQGYNPLELGQTTESRSQTDAESDMREERSGSSSSTTTQQQKGLGTWLPQVAGIALGAATGGLGFLPGIAGGLMGAAKGGIGAAMGNSGMLGGGNALNFSQMNPIGIPSGPYALGGGMTTPFWKR